MSPWKVDTTDGIITSNSIGPFDTSKNMNADIDRTLNHSSTLMLAHRAAIEAELIRAGMKKQERVQRINLM